MGWSLQDRLRFHQEHSSPLMKQLHGWMEAQLAERKTEPNSGLNNSNPFDYLTELLRHPTELKAGPAEWMPWNYRDTLAHVILNPLYRMSAEDCGIAIHRRSFV
jgi:hypothetical protein